ncbi:MAG TPA: DUF4097 family beta strand repeat-containing protein [Longimicrobiaceae bacterium]|nr:DUF4097 family beta strand repeat-containing protein [Longimicrobiaceae bacterium]
MTVTSRGGRATLALCAAALGALAASAAPAQRAQQSENEFNWTGQIPEGATVRVFTVSGRVNVTPSSGRGARIHGVKRRSEDGRGDLRHLEFEMRRDGNDIIVCGLYAGYSECEGDGIDTGRKPNRYGNNVRADFTVELPRGVHLRVGSGNGDLEVAGATANVSAASGNGDVSVGEGAGQVQASSGNGRVQVEEARGEVEASTGNGRVSVVTGTGPVNASSGNGSIDVRMGRIRGDEDMEFSSGNGSITLTLPPDFSGEIDATTGNGGIDSDFPVQVQGRLSRHRLHGTIGQGGRRIRLSTGNGSIHLRRT